MENKKEYSLVMLPTEKASKIGFLTKIGKERKDLRYYNIESPNILDSENQHLYIISNDEIKKNDWYIDFSIGSIKLPLQASEDFKNNIQHNCFKIVATTDESLSEIPKGDTFNRLCPEIPESFITAYIKSYNGGKPITEVQLEMEIHTVIGGGLLPTGEVGGKGNQAYNTKHIKTRPDNTVIIIEY